MAIRRYFDGVSLREIETPDPPLDLPGVTQKGDVSVHALLARPDPEGQVAAPTALPTPAEPITSGATSLQDEWSAAAPAKLEAKPKAKPKVASDVDDDIAKLA